MSTLLGELERDALGEAFNIALGGAAASFADLVNEEVGITVPEVELLRRQDLAARLSNVSLPGLSERLCSITQSFHNVDESLSTETLLLFAEQGGLEIVRRMLGEVDMPLEQITELEQDALGEIGNIIINSCMCTLSEIFESELIGSLPEVTQSSAAELFQGSETGDMVLMARIGLSMSSQNVTGYVLFLMDMPSLEHVIAKVRQYFGLDAALGGQD
ncbi:chemotaxis protein CheC [Roseateles sp.]|uniref:chemotaxis protein CheC n=1 Tax=Roseateles sp. TaxID=1971397 RepID=UPI003BA5E9FA